MIYMNRGGLDSFPWQKQVLLKVTSAALFVATFLLFVNSLTAVAKADSDNSRPNIVFILVDDLGYSDIGAYNPDSFYETPNIDRLARSGVQFTNGYAANPVCSPSRYAILTGKHPTRVAATDYFRPPGRPHGFGKFLPAAVREYLPHEENILPERLKTVGYNTAFLGKWHLGEEENLWPEHHGFDINFGGNRVGHPTKGYFSPYGNPRLLDGPKGEYLTERLTDEAIRLVDDMAGKEDPFLLYLSFYTVHTPLQAPANTISKYEKKGELLRTGNEDFGTEEQVRPGEKPRRVRLKQNHSTYAAMVAHMDHNVGRLLAKLESSGLSENTIVVFTSDNGGLSTSEGLPTSNLPLRAGKGWLYEGGVRVPYIIAAPGAEANGTVDDTPVVSTDLLPTLLDLVDVDYLDHKASLDGRSLKTLLGKKSVSERGSFERRPIFFHYPHYSNQGGFPGAAVRLGDWKLIERFEDGRVQLYNLAGDIGEQFDLGKTNPEKLAQMRDLLHAWYIDTGARFLEANPETPKYGAPWRPPVQGLYSKGPGT